MIDNDSVYLQGTNVEKERFSDCSQKSFEWNIIYDCNYRCPHCIFEGKWDEYRTRTRFLTATQWLAVWERIYRRYGRASILITGGEPFYYPGFIDIVAAISQVHYPINISTNSSGDLTAVVEKWDPQRVSLSFSFQPNFNTLSEVIERTRFLADKGFARSYINFCAYPPYLSDLDRYVAQARNAQEILKIVPFYGVYGGKDYPAGYSDTEKMQLGITPAWETNVMRRGKYCTAGKNTALIYPDGKVARCGQIGERISVGNIFDDDFALLERAQPCDVDFCPCLEAELSELNHE
ncbi:MAG: radical SAM protein [Elusimicrobia bacterium]|nr:radical SAM protein [Elusimicrobiota bacterium]